jgi:hypothetical protein
LQSGQINLSGIPSVFAVIFPIYFLFLWLLVGATISVIGGWFSLAKVYRTRVPFNGAKWRMQSGQMRWLTNYNRVLTLGTSQEGLFSQHVPFSVHAPSAACSMERDQGAKEEGLGVRVRDIHDGARVGNPFCGFARSWGRRCGRRLETVGPSRRRERQTELCDRLSCLTVCYAH